MKPLSRRRWIKTGLIFCPWLVLPHDRVNCSSFLPIATLEQDTYLWAFKTVKNNSGSVSAQTIMRANGFIQAILPIRSKLVRLNLEVGNNLAAFLSPIINDAGSVVDANTGFVEANAVESTGLTDDGTKYSDTGLLMTSMGTDNSTHLGIYSRTNPGAFGPQLGTYDGTNVDYYFRQTTTGQGNMHGSVNGVSVTSDDGIGHYVVSRNASNDLQIYKNGVSKATQASPGGTRVGTPYNVLVHAFNSAGTVPTKQSGASAGYHIGTGLSAADVLLIYNAFQAINTLYARQV